MSRVQRTLIALGMAFALPTPIGAFRPPEMSRRLFHFVVMVLLFPGVLTADTSALSGTWRSAPDELPLSTTFDESVWGKNAKSIRIVEMAIRPAGDATLTVNRRVVDAKGRTVPGSASIERADLVLATTEKSTGVRSELAVTVKQAERRYPDDPAATWALDGLRVQVATFSDKPGELEVRVDFPEGRGSFWATLRRVQGNQPRRDTRTPSTTP
jgi:hypothetical protein